MAKKPAAEQSGGVNIQGGTVSTGGGDIVGRDKIVGQDRSRQIEKAFEPITDLINALDPAQRAKAAQELQKLKQEAAKDDKRDDGVMAKLTEGLVKLVPTAASAVVSAFGSPILGAIAGPVTKYVIDKLKGDDSIQV